MESVTFQALAWHAEDIVDDDGDQFYTIKVFGRDIEGRSVSGTLKRFTPFFFIKFEEHWDYSTSNGVIRYLDELLNPNANDKRTALKMIKRKDFWGFTNNTEFNFCRVVFKSLFDMRHAISLLSRWRTVSATGSKLYKFKLYESNFEPYLRMMHIAGVEPTGWITVENARLKTDVLPTSCDIDFEVHWKHMRRHESDQIAPFLIASFDIECTSSSGDFPLAKKTYKHMSSQLIDIYNGLVTSAACDYKIKTHISAALSYALALEPTDIEVPGISRVETKKPVQEPEKIAELIDDIITIMKKFKKEQATAKLVKFFGDHRKTFPPLCGDGIIQIGTTFHYYGSKEIHKRHIVTLGTCDPIDGAEVVETQTEQELLLCWRKLIQETNPDIMTGYNIFGFDFEYMYHRSQELDIDTTFMQLSRFSGRECNFKEMRLSSSALGDNFLKYIDTEGRVLVDLMKIIQRDHKLDSYKLDNVANHFMGLNKNDVSPQEIFALQKGTAADRCRIASYCIQDCALCNFLVMKLEIFANNMGMSNVCLVPMSFIFLRGQGIKIFSLVLNECKKAEFLIPVIKKDISIRSEDVDALVPEKEKARKVEEEVKRIIKSVKCDKRLETIKQSAISAGIINYANKLVTGKPVSQEKIKDKYKWVTDEELYKMNNIIIENGAGHEDTENDGYEGAIVLDPKEDIYINDSIVVLDFASLYPSSMISENLSPDCLVIDPKYDNIPGVEYLDITYDIFDDKKVKVREHTCRYVQGEKGILPRILMKLLGARKATRKKMTWKNYNGIVGPYSPDSRTITDSKTGEVHAIPAEHGDELPDAFNEFQVAVLDGLQNAYKVTANSLYGQMGAKTSPIYMKDIAAATTATGRKMIMMAKDFLETKYNANIIYGDTDSIFAIFPQEPGVTKHATIAPSMRLGIQASSEFKKTIKAPHDLEFEKIYWPFILCKKKKYVGNMYEKDDKKYKQKSMGIVLKRRDNANIVKKIYGGIIDIILGEQNLEKSIDFLKTCLLDLINGKYPLDDLVITKSLRAEYKDPTRIAHKVLAERIAEREPGNKPQCGDRIPYLYVQTEPPTEKGAKVLQGERIETPMYVHKHGLKPDYNFYITNQIMKPLLQIYALVVEKLPGFAHPPSYYKIIERTLRRELANPAKEKDKMDTIREMDVKALLFDPILAKIENVKIRKSLIAKKYYKEDPVPAP